jgi:hypothetical protein
MTPCGRASTPCVPAPSGDVGYAIQRHAWRNGYSVVRDFCGHGIGREMHEPPQVLHWGRPKTGLILREGMVFTIEPMLNQGRHAVHTEDDGWTVVTSDGKLSAQFERTVAVTRNGVRADAAARRSSAALSYMRGSHMPMVATTPPTPVTTADNATSTAVRRAADTAPARPAAAVLGIGQEAQEWSRKRLDVKPAGPPFTAMPEHQADAEIPDPAHAQK